MQKNKWIRSIFFVAFILGANKCCSQDAFSPIQTVGTNQGSVSERVIDLNKSSNQASDASKTIDLSESDTFYNLTTATDRFVQCNIRASWDDFRTLIKTTQDNDFIYMSLANKMADLGLFDLADFASSKIKDKDIAGISLDAMKRFYYPRKKLRREDELILAEAYSNILYNNQSSEAVNELLKNETLLSYSDYANYLVALGSHKSNFSSRAKKYINIALLQNPNTLNYQKLKAEILADGDEPEEAMKVVDNLKKQNLYSYEYERKIKSLEQFILYKTKKAEWEKNYHLGYYCYLENDNSKAVRTLQTALSSKGRSNTALIYALMSEIYLSMNEFEKASDSAKKAYRMNRNLPQALLTLGDLSYRDKNYKQAMDYYKRAASADKKSYKPLVAQAKTYQRLSNDKKAKEIYTKVLKTHFDSWEAYYNIALLEPDKTTIYLKKALAINPLFEDAWVDLAKVQISSGNYDLAQKYLSNAFYIDENDFRYYYYQGLLCQNTGDYIQAKFNFKKCLKLNSNFNDAQKALDSLEGGTDTVKQDSI